jgi:hypothetical protein
MKRSILLVTLALVTSKAIQLSNIALPVAVDTDGNQLSTGEADVLRLANGTYLLYMRILSALVLE